MGRHLILGRCSQMLDEQGAAKALPVADDGQQLSAWACLCRRAAHRKGIPLSFGESPFVSLQVRSCLELTAFP